MSYEDRELYERRREIRWTAKISYSGNFYYIRVPRDIGKRYHKAEGEIIFRIIRKKGEGMLY